jgi:D-alanyl-D-alanine carboxypeptidase
MAAGLRTIVLAGFFAGGIYGFVLPDLKLADLLAVHDRLVRVLGVNAEPFDPMLATAIAKRGPSSADRGPASDSEARGAAAAERPEVLATAAPVQLAMLTAPDLAHADTKEVPMGVKPLDDDLLAESSIDRYLWSLYQRAPKVDSVKVTEQKKASVVEKGRLRTIVKNLVKVVREDFGWKDPKAADKVGMPMMEYVIGGMDRNFKLRLYPALRAMDDAGLAPGITSAFRDDYRQSLASGLKAATDRSYHGGSSRGGYGHGLAVDLVSVKGETAAERWLSSEKLWKWIDEHGKEFGIGRPYLDKDPAHVAPIDGKEYAAHHHEPKAQHSPRKRLAAGLVR